MADVELVDILSRLRADDPSVLNELFQAHYPSICKTIHRFIIDKNLVEDLAQEVFIRFWRKRQDLNITSSVPAYLRRMAINEALGYLRKNKHYEEEITPNTMGGTMESGEEQFLYTELEGSIKEAIDGLPPRCRAVFQLSRFEDHTYQEIADKMEISIKTVENQMSKALRILRKQLSGYLQLILIWLINGW
ncbi:MAG: RNA polymerase sigma factor SigX [Saprospiraceae bacterium]|nr:MAG: RNA polymerase sigma factor SigX [Saprospiraceae bacterium]